MTTFTTEDRIAIEQGTSEWHELRRGKVTASRVADILAKTKTGPSASRQNYLIELALQRTTKTIQPSYTNDAMAWGTATEPQARVAYEVKTGNFVDQVPFIDHPTIEGFGCSPDGLVGDGLIEIKCPNSATHWNTLNTIALLKNMSFKCKLKWLLQELNGAILYLLTLGCLNAVSC